MFRVVAYAGIGLKGQVLRCSETPFFWLLVKLSSEGDKPGGTLLGPLKL